MRRALADSCRPPAISCEGAAATDSKVCAAQSYNEVEVVMRMSLSFMNFLIQNTKLMNESCLRLSRNEHLDEHP